MRKKLLETLISRWLKNGRHYERGKFEQLSFRTGLIPSANGLRSQPWISRSAQGLEAQDRDARR